jgi:hypothetical protein
MKKLSIITAVLLSALVITSTVYGAESSPILKASVSEQSSRDPKAPDDYRKASTWLDTITDSCAARDKTGTVIKPLPKQVVSSLMRGKDEAYLMTLDVSGQEYLSLRVSDGGDGNGDGIGDTIGDGIGKEYGDDFFVWANAKLTTADGQEVWLDELKPEVSIVGYGPYISAAKEIEIGNKKFQHQLYGRATSKLCYRLDPARKFKTFEAYVGIAMKAGGGSVQFMVDNLDDAEVRRDWPFWNQLMQDFPDQRGLIYAAFDWCRQDKLDFWMPASVFELKAKECLTQSGKVLKTVASAGGDVKQLGDRLKALEETFAGKDVDWKRLYFEVHGLRRKILLSHPALNFDKILFNCNPPTTFSHNGDQHLGRHSRIGLGLSVLSDWKSDKPQVKAILEGKLPAGAVRNPDLNYDADKVVFGFCDHSTTLQKRYFIYEAAIDGSWVRQLTGTTRDPFTTSNNRATVVIEDNDPAYLPDGNLLFISSRCQSFGRCHAGRYVPAMVLYSCDNNGDNIRQLSYNNENEYEPSILNDGKVIFCRWEYTNRNEMFFHKLWQCRPDGSNISHYFGNDMAAPMMITEARAIPGTRKVVATAMGHHTYSTGTTVVLDVDKGENGEQAITHITPETSYSESQGMPNPHYSHPYPITETLFLVSRANHPVPSQLKAPPPNDRGIYLIDAEGSRELLYENPDVASVSPIAIRKRERPPVLPKIELAKNADEMATVYVQNAYLTRNDPKGLIKPGSIKAIRVNALGVQPRAKRSLLSAGVPVEIPKKVLGTVPVDANGSAFFKVPARTSLQLQIIGEDGMAILTEKSFFYLQPGEKRSCVGCHESGGVTPPSGDYARGMVPMELKPGAGPQYKGGLSFMRTVQPVLDRYCISCHGLDEKKKIISLIHDGKMEWPQSYQELVKRGEHRLGQRHVMWFGRNISRPYAYYAFSNKVAMMLEKNHSNVNMDRDSTMRVIEFLDLNAQCYGDLFPNKLEERQIAAKALAELRAYVKDVFGEKLAAQPERALVNTVQVDESRILMAPLASAAGGWGQIKGWADKNDPGFQKMQQLVEKCIIRSPTENTNGWEPTFEQGGGEKWVVEEQQKYLMQINAKTK